MAATISGNTEHRPYSSLRKLSNFKGAVQNTGVLFPGDPTGVVAKMHCISPPVISSFSYYHAQLQTELSIRHPL